MPGMGASLACLHSAGPFERGNDPVFLRQIGAVDIDPGTRARARARTAARYACALAALRPCRWAFAGTRKADQVDVDTTAHAEHGRAFETFFKFAHVPRPVVIGQPALRDVAEAELAHAAHDRRTTDHVVEAELMADGAAQQVALLEQAVFRLGRLHREKPSDCVQSSFRTSPIRSTVIWSKPSAHR
ncbi:hypothetical protein [Accumulibacter sp.]|uniref:hypothetical protein n=1 Tax=Accumulibacter sp. TaxID=2053492 RepID=UPI002601722F|nr:hypothetical protein [Accumulibacter sp.]